MSEVVIQVDSLAKQYRLGVLGTGTLGHDLNRWWHRIRGKEDPYTQVGDKPAADPQSAKNGDEMWALRGVSFEVNQGDVLAIVGRNGAGKSTLLKILTRVTAPTSGEVRIKGRIASLLEVGTGFHPELTGRENIFLNGTILGMSKAEITRKLDEIVAFAEVDRHLDTPVKRYSSGMYVRLAFAVAAHLEPEILIVDEVLAVGDAEFQKKCLGKMKDVANDGRTILFVSHNLEAVRRLCTRGILIQSGRVAMDSDIEQVAEAYTKTAAINTPKVLQNRNLGLTIFDIKLRNQDGQYGTTFRPGDDLIVELSYEAKTPIPLPFFSIVIFNFKGSCFAANMRLDGFQPRVLSGTCQLSCVFKSVPLLPQSYTVQLAVHASNGRDQIIRYHDVAHFDISGDLAEYGYQGRFMTHTAQSTSVVIPYEWHLPDGTVKPVALSRLATHAQPLNH
jgi:lipopolysaccharide transport system ATP-binding protein